MTERLDPLPARVIEEVAFHFDLLESAVDPGRVAAFPKESVWRGAAWDATVKYGKTIGVKEGENYSGWRKCHTEDYWVYYALELE